ncbi:hypothetical protein AVEN_66836-1 [Araneus ventricosus]|uniref:Uncharacterized protein n=1 Tax=Araneus ventricosus TaxID=182803 RepID=A0A4Y2DQG9_ARAVE|nr:hypothetical protein AVEN_66836-1 [Araneus ventricosus]
MVVLGLDLVMTKVKHEMIHTTLAGFRDFRSTTADLTFAKHSRLIFIGIGSRSRDIQISKLLVNVASPSWSSTMNRLVNRKKACVIRGRNYFYVLTETESINEQNFAFHLRFVLVQNANINGNVEVLEFYELEE